MDQDSPTEKPSNHWKKIFFQSRLPLVLGVSMLLFALGIQHRKSSPSIPEPQSIAASEVRGEPSIKEIVIPLPTPLPPWPAFTHPTPQRNWNEVENPRVYMPTGSGRVASAGYGSVRTNSSGRASFHEGVDIAPVEWSRGKAVDKVYAASNGEIVYVNRTAGNSSYGIYIVIEHQDKVGEVYTIYAHLASVSRDIKAGKTVRAGEPIAVMGHTSTLGIPAQRSHLHFEMGMMLNPDFDRWYKVKKMTPDHGRYHGFNFVGFDPRLMLIPLTGKEQVPFSYLQTLIQKEAAWELLVKNAGRPRYFDKYPALWKDEEYEGKAFYLRVSESGIPLSGRNATKEELLLLGRSKTKVAVVHEDTLGRNGLRHVVKSRGQWVLGNNGTRWLEIFLYNAR